MIWNYTDKGRINNERIQRLELVKDYLSKISDEELYAYNVYQIEGEGRHYFPRIKGDENTIMGFQLIKLRSI